MRMLPIRVTKEGIMCFKQIFTLFLLIFFFISNGLIFAVEPTTFPTKKSSIIDPNKSSNTKVINTKQRPNGIPIKKTNEPGVLVEPTMEEKTPPKTKS